VPDGSQGGRLKEFSRWPKYYDLYLRTFEKMLDATEKKKKKALYWKTAQDVMDWWIYEMPKEDPNQEKFEYEFE
jgi:phosphoadenosine phosphosulfate reductase